MRTGLIRWTSTLSVALFLCWPALAQETSHYSRFKDAKWYARQLQSLQEEVAKVDSEVRALVEARKSGKGVTGAVALEEEPEGVTSEGQLEVLKKRRVLLLRQIDALEEQARHNAIVPGELRTEYGPEEAKPGQEELGREAKELENSLAEEREHLEHVRKEAELLRRNQKLKAQQEYSNPEPRSRRDKPSELAGINKRLIETEQEVAEAEQRVADMEDRLEDLRRDSPADSAEDTAASAEPSSGGDKNDEKSEAYWRKQFAAIDYKISTAQTELDILQREHNDELVQYYPNPATALKESVTRKDINEHRKAIEDKKKEIQELKRERGELEDALRHAGGPAGWARK